MGNSNGKPVVFTDQVNLNHFRLLRVVGKGAFGKVRIVERKDNCDQFALKYIRKDEVVRSESVRNIIRERRMLEHLRHPFLCNLRYSFQDIEYLYLVVDLMTGGDLRFHISRKTFTEEAVRFWIAELGCALRYIHSQGIVHRDVKPDNVLLDKDGHVHLADFNVASDFKPEKPLTSRSGTLAYLAPEVYVGKGYSCEVDWWSLGVLFYECIYNKRPFEASNHDLLSKKIIKGEPAYPVTNPPVSMPCLHAISSLLEKDKRQRIGAAGFETFSDNPFFRPINFHALEAKEIDPVFLPSSEKTNFDATYDLEELLLEEAPLEARARRQKPREQLKNDATDAEIRAEELHKMIETLFEPFDYTLVPLDDRGSDAGNTPTSATAITPTDFSKLGQGPISRAGSAHESQPTGTPIQNRSRASTQSPNGSPPLPTMSFDLNFTSTGQIPRSVPDDYISHNPNPRSIPDDYHNYLKDTNTRIEDLDSPVVLNPSKRQKKASRATSGSQTLVTPSNSWTEHGEPMTAGSGAMSSGDEREKRPSGVLGFLARKKGRDRSPKAKERGVLGKEGARVVISNS